MKTKRALCCLVLLLTFAFLFQSCASKQTPSAEPVGESTGGNTGAVPPKVDIRDDVNDQAPSFDKGSDLVSGAIDRKIIRTFEYTILTQEFDQHYQQIIDSAKAAGGYVESSRVEGTKPQTYNDSGRYAQMVLKVPADKVEQYVAGIVTIGTVTYQNSNATDVSDQYIDLESRISVLRIQHERLTKLLTDSANLSDIITLEQEIARVTIEIEQLTSNLEALSKLVDYSTVTVWLQEERIPQGPGSVKTVGTRINEGFASVLDGMAVFFENLFVFLVVSSPVWGLLGVVAVVVIVIVKRNNRKKKVQNNNDGATE